MGVISDRVTSSLVVLRPAFAPAGKDEDTASPYKSYVLTTNSDLKALGLTIGRGMS